MATENVAHQIDASEHPSETRLKVESRGASMLDAIAADLKELTHLAISAWYCKDDLNSTLDEVIEPLLVARGSISDAVTYLDSERVGRTDLAQLKDIEEQAKELTHSFASAWCGKSAGAALDEFLLSLHEVRIQIEMEANRLGGAA